jgi:hypothetical protein
VLWEAAILGTFYRVEPKLSDLAIALYMNVGRLAAIGTEEDETV